MTRLILASPLTARSAADLHEWVLKQNWPQDAQLKQPHRYHLTALYCDDCSEIPPQLRRTLKSWPTTFILQPENLDLFTNPGHFAASPIVLRLVCPQWQSAVNNLAELATSLGMQPSLFGPQPVAHVTLGVATTCPVWQPYPGSVRVGPLVRWVD